jgi:hypothetical protein
MKSRRFIGTKLYTLLGTIGILLGYFGIFGDGFYGMIRDKPLPTFGRSGWLPGGADDFVSSKKACQAHLTLQ